MSRILIVDDDEQLGRSLQRVLGRDGHVSDVAESIDDARRFSAAFEPDLVLIELAPAETQGFYALHEQLRAMTGAGVPVIFMSGHPATLAQMSAFATPLDDRMMKPCDPHELRRRVDAALARARRR
jgi:DNA-binding response OmpR family regulator